MNSATIQKLAIHTPLVIAVAPVFPAYAAADLFTFEAQLTLEVPGFGSDVISLAGLTTVTRGLVVPGVLDKVDIEIVSMSLSGVSAVFGTVNLTESPTRISGGEVLESANVLPGDIDFPANGSFDLFVRVGLPDKGVSDMFNDTGLRMQGLTTGFPMDHGDVYRAFETPIPLFRLPDPLPQPAPPPVGFILGLSLKSVPEPSTLLLAASLVPLVLLRRSRLTIERVIRARAPSRSKPQREQVGWI